MTMPSTYTTEQTPFGGFYYTVQQSKEEEIIQKMEVKVNGVPINLNSKI